MFVRRSCRMTCASLVTSVGVSLAVAAPTFPFDAQTTRDEANIRAGSTITSETLAQLPRRTTLEVLAEHAGWYRIRLPKNAQCYVAAQYVDAGGAVTGSRVNVRAGAGRQCSILGQVHRGDRLRVIERHGEWARIEPLPTLTGWIRADLVTPAEHASTPATAAATPPMPSTPVSAESATESSGLAATTVAALATATDHATVGAAVLSTATATGILEPTRGFLQPSKYRLTQAGQTTHYLRTDQDLSDYRHLEVNVWGAVDTGTRATHPIVLVERIARIR